LTCHVFPNNRRYNTATQYCGRGKDREGRKKTRKRAKQLNRHTDRDREQMRDRERKTEGEKERQRETEREGEALNTCYELVRILPLPVDGEINPIVIKIIFSFNYRH